MLFTTCFLSVSIVSDSVRSLWSLVPTISVWNSPCLMTVTLPNQLWIRSVSDNLPSQIITLSPLVNAEDAEIAFRSSDNVVFKIHRKNLEVNTAVLSPAALTTSTSELVPLSEDAPTLELLFQYIYPRRQPLLDDIEFALLASLAEAAEKYEVFAAMTVCYIRMRYVQTWLSFLQSRSSEFWTP